MTRLEAQKLPTRAQARRADAEERRMPRDYDVDGTPEGVFGAELRFYRTQAGLSQAELAALVSISHDVISKIETGERAPAKAFPERLDAVPELDTRAALARLWNRLSKSARQRAYPGWFDRWPDAEARALALLWWEPLLIPGLLQTREYAHEVLRRGQPGKHDGEIEQQVQARMDRQQILDGDDPPMLIAVVDEGALRRPVGGPGVMHDQLARLAELAERSKIVLQVVPVDAGPHPGTAGPMVIASFDGGPDLAYLDTALEGQLVERHEDVAMVALLYDTLRAEALPMRASLELIAKVKESWT